CEPIEREGRNGRRANGELCGGEEGFAGLGFGGVRRVRAHHGAQRKAEARGGKKKKERLMGQDWWQRGRRAALVTHQHILTDSRCP
ncbi:hypothetical protein JOQ06_006666, partial [Pogonophryne albipinna]